ncbi:unnamed protein product [Ectocarpus sp. 4 AP-2014]
MSTPLAPQQPDPSGAAAAGFISSADGFMSPAAAFLSAASRATTTSATTRRTPRAPTAMLSYADKLREAQAAKAAKAADCQASPLSPQPETTPPPPPAVAAAAATPAPPSGGAMPQVAESPFSESLQEELRVAITILAARLQREKPMSRQEFERFESAVGVIVEDALPLQKLPSPASPASPAAAAAAAAPPRLVVTQSPAPNGVSDGDDDDDFETEGPEWDAKKVQYGLPLGARNTYDIDDMEKMNPEEYQAALREKVVERAQSVRKTGSYG